MSTQLPHAIVLGLSPTGLYVARELGRSGVPLMGVDRAFSCAGVSRYFDRGGVWYESSSARLLQQLLEAARLLVSKPVLIPTSDYYIEFVIQHYSILSPVFKIAPCYAGVAEVFLDKSKFYELCTRHNMETPRVWRFDSFEALLSLEDVPYPCILKPTLIHLAKSYLRGKKVLVAHNRDELLRLAQALPRESGSWQVQEIIPGQESRITLVAGYAGENDIASDTFTAQKIRQFPPGFGSASKVLSQNCDESRALTLRLIELVGLRGIYGAEFKRDPRDGKLKIIEINPRPTLWFHISHTAGKRLVARAYYDLAGCPLADKNEQRDGIVWQYAIKDFAAALFYRFKGKAFIFCPPDASVAGTVSGRSWPVFSLTDPLPFFAEIYVYLTKFIGRVA